MNNQNFFTLISESRFNKQPFKCFQYFHLLVTVHIRHSVWLKWLDKLLETMQFQYVNASAHGRTGHDTSFSLAKWKIHTAIRKHNRNILLHVGVKELRPRGEILFCAKTNLQLLLFTCIDPGRTCIDWINIFSHFLSVCLCGTIYPCHFESEDVSQKLRENFFFFLSGSEFLKQTFNPFAKTAFSYYA